LSISCIIKGKGSSFFFPKPVKPNFITKATKLQELLIRDTPATYTTYRSFKHTITQGPYVECIAANHSIRGKGSSFLKACIFPVIICFARHCFFSFASLSSYTSERNIFLVHVFVNRSGISITINSFSNVYAHIVEICMLTISYLPLFKNIPETSHVVFTCELL
jgi:hypothetical protein